MKKKRRWWAVSPLMLLFIKASPVWAAVTDGVATLGGDEGVEGVLERILNAALSLLGLAVGVMIIVGGFQLLTSGGSKEGVQKAKGTFTSAIIGLVLAILSWFILVFIKDFTGVNVTEFAIPN